MRRMALAPAALAVLTGCISSRMLVTSEPAGAQILRDGQRTGRVTPAEISPFNGTLTVTIEGYRTPEPYSVRARVAAERIVVTVLVWPVGAILWGFQFVAPEEEQYHFVLRK